MMRECRSQGPDCWVMDRMVTAQLRAGGRPTTPAADTVHAHTFPAANTVHASHLPLAFPRGMVCELVTPCALTRFGSKPPGTQMGMLPLLPP